MENKGLFQKLLALFIILLVPVFIIANFSLLKSKNEITNEFKTEFIPKDEYLTEKAFVFVLWSGADKKSSSLEQNIHSIFSQKYDKYRVIILHSDQKQDELQKIKQQAARENKLHLVTFIETTERYPTINSYCEAIETCLDDEIIVQINSNDWLAHENVLRRLNETHTSSKEIWLTYSQYLEYPSYKKGDQEPYIKRMLRNRKSRKIPYISAHFKTYYAGLFKQISPDPKFTYKKALDRENIDLYILPMVEVSKNHIRFIDDVLYIHNITILGH